MAILIACLVLLLLAIAERKVSPFVQSIPAGGLTWDVGDSIETTAISPDGERFAVGEYSGEGGVQLWNLNDGKPVERLWPGVQLAAITFLRIVTC